MPISRRLLLRLTGAGLLGGCGLNWTNAIARANPIALAGSIVPESSESDRALSRLLEGNRRYVSRQQSYPHQSQVRLQEVAVSQAPFAIVLGCADSRVPPELLFDQGLGDLFVIRVAGNIVDDAVLGSLEFAVAELGVPLLLVLGHERCGAIAASLSQVTIPGHISTLTNAIQPVLDRVRTQSGDRVDNAVRANVQYVVEQLREAGPILAQAIGRSKLAIVGGRYDLDSGVVELIA